MLYPQGRFEVRRFRPNIVVETTNGQKGFVENAWIGQVLAIGDVVRLSITGPCPRCVMTTLPQGDLPKDSGILRTAAQHNRANVGSTPLSCRAAGSVVAIRSGSSRPAPSAYRGHQRSARIVSVSGYLITSLRANLQPLPPKAEWGWWYQYYFATERGKLGYSENRYEFNKLIWKNVSTKWDFDDATFDRTAESFNNPDHVSIVIHNYRWRLNLAKGEPRYDDLEQKLFEAPVITVPTITIASDFDDLAADGASCRKKFSGKYSHRIFKGIGHNVPKKAMSNFRDGGLACQQKFLCFSRS